LIREGAFLILWSQFWSRRGIPSLVLAASQLTTAAGLMALPTFTEATDLTLHQDALSALVILGTLGIGVAYVLNYRIIRDDGAVTASVVTYILPAVAIALGWIVLGEIPASVTALGAAIVLLGVALARQRPG
jgi:drug/metabolite transporter (DMT)-like permease